MVSRHTILRTVAAAGVLALAAGCSSMSSSDRIDTYQARLSASQEVPPNPSAGTGQADVTFNPATNRLTWRVTYSGLTAAATAGHIHGPAGPGANAGVLVPFQNITAQPVQGEATITPAQAADLAAGRWYVNIHTPQYPGGEVRGQLQKR